MVDTTDKVRSPALGFSHQACALTAIPPTSRRRSDTSSVTLSFALWTKSPIAAGIVNRGSISQAGWKKKQRGAVSGCYRFAVHKTV